MNKSTVEFFKSHIGHWVKLIFAHEIEYYKIVDICEHTINQDCVIAHCLIDLRKRRKGSPKYVTRYFGNNKNYFHLPLYERNIDWYEFLTDEQMIDIYEKEFSRRKINPEEWNGNIEHSKLIVERNEIRENITDLQRQIIVTKKAMSCGFETNTEKLKDLREVLSIEEHKLKDINKKIKPCQHKFGRDWNSLKDCYDVDMYFRLLKSQLKNK